MCTSSFSLLLKGYPHSSHMKGPCSCTSFFASSLTCCISLLVRLLRFFFCCSIGLSPSDSAPECEGFNLSFRGIFQWTVLMCLVKSLRWRNSLPQSSQGCLTLDSLCTKFLCSLRAFLLKNREPQRSQTKIGEIQYSVLFTYEKEGKGVTLQRWTNVIDAKSI